MKKILLLFSLFLCAIVSYGQHGNFIDLRLINGDSVLAGTNRGTVYYDRTLNLFRFRDNSQWIPLSTSYFLHQGSNTLTQDLSFAGPFNSTWTLNANNSTVFKAFTVEAIDLISGNQKGKLYIANEDDGFGGVNSRANLITYPVSSAVLHAGMKGINGIVDFGYFNGGTFTGFEFTGVATNQVRFIDGRSGANADGIRYNADYSANFVSRSLIDKGFSDAGTQTLTNKSISGASNTFTNIPLSTAVTGDLPFANLTQGSARSVLGVTGNSTADVASIQGTADQVLRVNGAGTALGFGTIAAAAITPGTDTYILTTTGGVPVWAAPSGGGPSLATSAQTLAGTNDATYISPLKNAEVNQRVYNVKSATYGAKGNGRLGVAGTSANGSPNLTCTDCAFVATDAGAYIKVGGAGAAGVDFVGTILTYTDATHVVLSANASTTVSGTARVTYGNDDTAAIQAAINAAFAAGVGGTIWFPIGNYLIAGALQTSVSGMNPNSQLYIPTLVLTDANIPGVTFEGEGIPLAWNFQTANNPTRTGGAILISTIVGSGTRPRVIGAAYNVASGYTFNPATVTFKNLAIQTRTMTSNAAVTPSMTAFGMLQMSVANFEDCTAQTEGPLFSSVLPTVATAIGFELPGINNAGNLNGILVQNCSANGYYVGFEASDHAVFDRTTAFVNVYGYSMTSANQPIHWRAMQSFENKYDAVFAGTTTINCSGVLKIEENGTTGRWNDNVYNFYAPSGSATVYGKIDFYLNQVVVNNGTFTGTFWRNVYLGESQRYAVYGGGSMPRFGGTAEWAGPSATGASNKAVFEIRGALSESGNAGYTDFAMSHGQSGTSNLVSRQVVYNNDIIASDHRLKDQEVYTDGAINKGMEQFYYHNGTSVQLVLELGSDRVKTLKPLTFRTGSATAGTAPWIMVSGPLLTTPIVGAGEFLNDKAYLTITTGTARKEFTLNDAALTSGRVAYATTNGRLTDSGSLTFDGTNLTTGTLTTSTATFTGKATFVTSGSGAATWTAPHGTAPSSPVNGDFWTTTAAPFFQINGVTWTIPRSSGTNTWTGVQTYSSSPVVPTSTTGTNSTDAASDAFVQQEITANAFTAAEGTYTPTLTNNTNVAASTAYVTGYYRLGNSVTVYGKIDIDATLAASTATEMGISLPIASDLAAEEDLGGSAVSDAVASLTARIKADAANNRASVVFKALSLTNDSYGFEFSYQVK